eukprot:s6209_g2.t1
MKLRALVRIFRLQIRPFQSPPSSLQSGKVRYALSLCVGHPRTTCPSSWSSERIARRTSSAGYGVSLVGDFAFASDHPQSSGTSERFEVEDGVPVSNKSEKWKKWIPAARASLSGGSD